MKQHTLQNKFVLTGKGLHTGLQIEAVFLPAQPNTGIRLKRTDLPGQPCYEALADYVCATERGTVLQNGDWKVSTVEHALSALYAMGVTNCLIELNAPEMPILDGSARLFVEEIKRVGLLEQEAEEKVFVVRHKMVFENKETGSKMVLLPDDQYSVDVHVDFPSAVLGNQYASLESLTDYEEQIASARTFCFVREVLFLLSKGLIQGGDLQNAMVIYDQPMSQESFDDLADRLGQPHQDASKLGYLCELHYNNEPARHKLLDLIGDLSLLGYRIQGKIIATRPGHEANTTFCKQLRNDLLRPEILPPCYDETQKPLLDIKAIRAILPHRYPMLFVDKVLSITQDSIVAVKNFTANEPFFQGHFPQEPVVPGVVLLEAMAQAGGLFVLHDKEDAAQYATYFLKIDKAKFRRKLVPGDTLVLHLSLIEPVRRGICQMQGYGFVGDVLAVQAELTAQITKNRQ